MFKGFSATFHSDTSAASIERALCCKSQGSPDADGQCQDVSLGSTDYKMHTCPDGFFLKGYHVKVPEVWDAEEQPDLEENCIGQNCWDQFRCCQLQSGISIMRCCSCCWYCCCCCCRCCCCCCKFCCYHCNDI